MGLAVPCVSGGTRSCQLKSCGARWICVPWSGSWNFEGRALVRMVVGAWALHVCVCWSLACHLCGTLFLSPCITVLSLFDVFFHLCTNRLHGISSAFSGGTVVQWQNCQAA